MKKYLMLLKLQIKSSFNISLRLLAVFICALFIAALSVYGIKNVFKGEDDIRISLGVVLPQEDERSQNILMSTLDYISQVEAVKRVCDFKYYEDLGKANESLRKKDADIVVVIPETFIGSILNGENKPAEIFVREDDIKIVSVFEDMIRAAASDIGTAQAGIYTIEDVLINPDREEIINANAAYFLYAIDRYGYFENIPADSNMLTLNQKYIISIIIIALLLGSVSCGYVFIENNNAFNMILRKERINTRINYIYKVVGISLVYILILDLMLFLAGLAVARFPAMAGIMKSCEGFLNTQSLQYGVESFVNLCKGMCFNIVVVMTVYSLAGLVYSICKTVVSGAVIMLALSTFMVYASGIIVPRAFIPEVVYSIGTVTPVFHMSKVMADILNGSMSITDYSFVVCCVYILVFIAAIVRVKVDEK